MNPNRTCQENMEALKKVLTQRTYAALSNKNIEFILAHQHDTLDELAAYLRRCQAELGHIPARTEVIGGDFIELRFRGWVNALCASGVTRALAVKCPMPALAKTALFQVEYAFQREQDKQEKRQKKAANKEKMRQEKSERKRAEKTPPSDTAGNGGAAE